ncbi:MAG: signal recognition particle protein Srp19, partial [Promethearchaeota archaeon]
TAGRHKEEKDLMKEMAEIESRIKPNETILIIDGTLGQQAFAQARVFAETTAVGSIIVTKLDGTARGGGALSACAATGAKIKFIGTGEKIEDLELFRPSAFVGELLGRPDIEGILEEIQASDIIADEETAARMLKGKLTLDDMLVQLRQLKKLKNLKKIFGLFGMGGALPPEMGDIAKGQIKKWEIVLQSMTKYEKENPKEIKGSRLKRIEIGSGATKGDVKKLLSQFDMMNKFMKKMTKNKKMMNQLAKGNFPAGGLPGGMPGFPGAKPPKGFRM